MRKFFNKADLSGIHLISLILVFLFFLISPYYTYSEEKDKNKSKTQNVVGKTQGDPFTTLLDINNITIFIQPNGFHPWNYGGGWSTAFPKGTAGGIFAEGMVWGGLVNDGQSPTLRVGGNTYTSGTKDLDRVYRVRPDYKTANLADDAANFFYFQNFPLDPSSVTEGDMDILRAQYAKDWLEWPADKGAPFDDVDDNGVYDPNVDIPGIPGASQTAWIYYNDDLAANIYGSPPIGLEVQETYWAYSIANPLGNAIFKRINIVYKGTENTPPNATIDDMYITQWSDPDVGQYTDDFAGCDTILNLGYAYSSRTTDAVYLGLGLAPPALGYDFLQGVSQYTGNPNDSAIVNLEWRKGYKYVHPPEKPMTTFVYFAAGGAWGDPDLRDPLGTPQWYNLMRGYLPRPPYPSSEPFPSPSGPVGGPGTYLLAGDPVAGAGWIDGQVEGPGDRRIVCNHGPFNMDLNDTAEVVIAMLGGIGSNNLTSISVLKFTDRFVQFAYDNLFDLPVFPSPSITLTNFDEKVLLNWGTDEDVYTELETTAPNGYVFQGYNVYQLPTPSSSLSDAVKIATFDLIDEITVILDDQLDIATGVILKVPVQVGKNSGIKRFIEITTDAVRNEPFGNGSEYYFAVTAYGYNPDETLPFNALESSPVVITAVPQSTTPGTRYSGAIGDTITAVHTGTADGGVTVTIVDPSAVTGDEYEIFFTEQAQIRNGDGDWVPAGSVLRKTRIMDPDTLTGSSVEISAIFSPTAGVIQLDCFFNYVTPDGNWADGIEMDFPAGMTIVDAPTFEAGGGTIVPEVVGNHINMGIVDGSLTGDGWFHGGETWSVYVSTFDPPQDIDWEIWDDGWSGGVVNAVGTTTLDEVGFASRLADHWNVKDLIINDVVLSDQSVINGTDLYPPRDDSPTDLGINAAPVIDGVQINLNIVYGAPVDFTTLTIDPGEGSYDIDSYLVNGWAATAMAIDTWGAGTTDIAELQKDYELRYTGEYDDPNASVVYVKEGTGSIATLEGARMYDLADHPMNPNPGSNDPFTVRIPFEVWSIDDDKQINLLVYDREGDPTVTPFYAFNPAARMYCHFLPTDYHETVVDVTGPEVDNLTWNTVWWEADWVNGDVLTFQYDNPIIKGSDIYTFKTEASTFSGNLAKDQVEEINVFPNPYYGFHSRETTREGKFVTFSHLTPTATIRIFDLAGVLVRTIEKDDPSQFTRWNLQNDSNFPVASGIYVVYIDIPELGTSKILKLAIVQEEQILRVY